MMDRTGLDSSSDATTRAVGLPAATSRAKLGPESTAIGKFGPAISRMTCDIRRKLFSSMPLLAESEPAAPVAGRTWTHITIPDGTADAHAVEFSKTVQPRCGVSAGTARGARLLYVAMTRAVQVLRMVGEESLSSNVL